MKGLRRPLIRLAVVATVTAIVPTVTSAAVTPVLNYSFPASWAGTGTSGLVVTDQSPAGHNGIISSVTSPTSRQPTLSSTVPPGAAAGTSSADTHLGGFRTNGTSLLTNALIDGAGGFSFATTFMWNGTDLTTNGHIQKLVDYAGTEALQVDTNGTAAAPGTAALNFIFTTQGVAPDPDVTVGPSLSILANTWYQATATFDSTGNTVDGTGNLAGLATLTLTPIGGSSTSASLAVTKTPYGDGPALGARPIGVGELGFASTTLALVPFQGNIYSASVSLGVVPEPASVSLLALGAAGLVARRRRA